MARYALVIGIADYTAGCFRSLETPVKNANAIADILDRHGDFNQVKRLPFRREAGQKDLGKVIRKPLPKTTLERELRQFLDDAEGSDVLLYYSGHGFTKIDTTCQKPVGGYLAPSDCQVKLDADRRVIAEENGISLSHGLNQLIQQHQFSSLVVILDCCNAGAFLESALVRQEVTQFGFQRDYYLITACRASSKAYEGEDHSLLTQAVLKGLAPDNALPESGRISGDRLFDVIGNELRNSRQEPIRMGWGRMITLVKHAQIPERSERAPAFNSGNPYMGLKPFEREQAEYFFGREQTVRSLLDRLDRHRFLAAIGPSGCGKSSLVRAGLLPELERDRIPGSAHWQIEIITPGQYPLQALAKALDRPASTDKPILLFVDQFEELFTLCDDEQEQRCFIKRLDQETSDPTNQNRIIVAMRGDFLDRCGKFQESADLINSAAPTTYMVTPLTETKRIAELEESIMAPATLHGVSFEPGLVARIVDDAVDRPGAMPLLQYTLTQLWEQCISPDGISHLLTLQGYTEIGEVKGALQSWASQFYCNLSHPDQTFVREMVSELVQISDDGEVTRRRASRERLRQIAASPEQLDRIIGRLVYQRLLVTDDQTVEVAHEALLSESKLIRGWIEENRDSIRLQQRLDVYRREWEEQNCAEAYLLGTGRLAAIEDWIANKQPRLIAADRAFIEQSCKRRDRALQAKQRKERQRWMLAAGLLATITLASLGIADQARKLAVASDESKIQTLVSLAKNQFDNQQQLESLVTSIQAFEFLQRSPMSIDKNQQYDNELKLIISKIHERNRWEAHSEGVIGLSFNPRINSFSSQEIAIASSSRGGIVKLWTIQGKLVRTLEDESTAIWNIRFSHDGKLLAGTAADGKVRLWDLDKSTPAKKISGHSKAFGIDFSPDGQMLASSGSNGKLLVWDLQADSWQTPIYTLQADRFIRSTDRDRPYQIYAIDYHPIDKNLIAYGGGDKSYDVWVWDQTSTQPQSIGQHQSSINCVRFSPDGSKLTTCSQSGVIKIWAFPPQENPIAEIQASQLPIYDLQFSPDGNFLASVAEDGNIRLWELEKIIHTYKMNQEVIMQTQASLVFSGHAGPVNGVDTTFFLKDKTSPINNRLIVISGGLDKSIRLWEKENIVLPETACSILQDYLSINSQIKSSCPG